VRQVGNALHAGTEVAAAFNPITSVGIGLNKLGPYFAVHDSPDGIVREVN